MMQKMRRFLSLTLAMLLLLAAAACSAAPASENADAVLGSGSRVLRILSGSENQDLEPMLERFAQQENIRIEMTYQGSLDIMRQLEQEQIPYDGVWPASSLWLTVGDTGHRVKHAESVSVSPVVFGIRKSLAEELGFVGREVSVSDLLEAIRQQAPDCIVITGDLVDCHRTNIAAAMEFVRGAVRMAPVYYVPGNHEGRIDAYRRLREELLRAGVVLLEDRKVMLARQGACIQLLGLRDPRFAPKEHRQDRERVEKKLRELMGTEEDRQFFQLLLSHRPELMPVYADCGVDMVLCGHAHGGQFRLFHQGLFAPQQGLFPKYTGGVHVKGTTAMVISRGLGNSEFPLRLNNPPELVKITLHCQPPAEEAGQAEEDE